MIKKSKEKVVFTLTEEFHDDITEIYEASVDDLDDEAITLIDKLRLKLKAFKENLTKNIGL